MNAQHRYKNFVTNILQEIAPQIGATLNIEPNYDFTGLISFKNGKQSFYRDTRFSVNPHGSVEISKDKTYSNHFMRQFGYRVPEGKAFLSSPLNDGLLSRSSIEDGAEYAISIGFPIILKPNSFSQGKLVTKIDNIQDYYVVAERIHSRTNVMIVEKFYSGRDFRIVVLEENIIAAYYIEPLRVVGNGYSSINELLQIKQSEFSSIGRPTIIDFEDYRMHMRLSKYDLSIKSILPKDTIFQLLDNSNISSGGIPYDYTDNLHVDFKNLAIKVTKDMQLKLCGIDIIAGDITSTIGDYVIVEINSAPGLVEYARMGEKQLGITRGMYLRILEILENT